MRFVGFIGPSYALRSKNVDCQRCINLYPEMNEIGTGKEKEIASLVSTPGLNLLNTIGLGPTRGGFTASNGSGFVVSKNKLYQINTSYVATELGTLNTSSGPISMADNGLQLMIVDGANGYYWDFNTSTFSEITDDAFTGADQVTFQDGYIVFNKPGTEQFGITGLSEITFDALDFASTEGNPDKLISVLSDHRNLWLFNANSVEVWYNSGRTSTDSQGDLIALFPFERIQGAYVEQGIAAAFSVAKMNNTVFWLGRDDKGQGMVYMANGYQPQRISTHAVELAIQSYGDISDAKAYCYQSNGHHFYVLNFTNANTTWVYDTTTMLWHERAYLFQGAYQRHRADWHMFFNGIHIVGDYENNNIYELSETTYTDNGNPIPRRRIAPHLSQDMGRIFYESLQLDIESGTGLDGIAQGTDPKIMMRFSDDGGHKFSNEKWASFGKIGQTKTRAIWRRLGHSRDRIFEITITDPVKVSIIGAELMFEPGAS